MGRGELHSSLLSVLRGTVVVSVAASLVFTESSILWSTAFADDSIGTLGSVVGKASVLRGGETIKATKGMKVFATDSLITSEKTAVKIIFNEGGTFIAFENANVKIEEYKVKSEGSEVSLKSAFNIAKGKVRFFVKPQPNGKNDVKYKTTNAVMGIRGTSGFIDATTPGQTQLVVLTGKVEVTNPVDPSKSVMVPPNFMTSVVGKDLPTKPIEAPPTLLSSLNVEASKADTSVSSGGGESSNSEQKSEEKKSDDQKKEENKQSEEKKGEEKKPEEKKSDDKKPDEKKQDERKTEEKKPDDKKVEEKKVEEKKSEPQQTNESKSDSDSKSQSADGKKNEAAPSANSENSESSGPVAAEKKESPAASNTAENKESAPAGAKTESSEKPAPSAVSNADGEGSKKPAPAPAASSTSESKPSGSNASAPPQAPKAGDAPSSAPPAAQPVVAPVEKKTVFSPDGSRGVVVKSDNFSALNVGTAPPAISQTSGGGVGASGGVAGANNVAAPAPILASNPGTTAATSQISQITQATKATEQINTITTQVSKAVEEKQTQIQETLKKKTINIRVIVPE